MSVLPKSLPGQADAAETHPVLMQAQSEDLRVPMPALSVQEHVQGELWTTREKRASESGQRQVPLRSLQFRQQLHVLRQKTHEDLPRANGLNQRHFRDEVMILISLVFFLCSFILH